MSILLEAIMNENVEAVQAFIDEAADAAWIQKEGLKALDLACMLMQAEIVALLLPEGVDPNQVVSEDRTPLHNACFNGDIASVELLLEYGALVNGGDLDGKMPLMDAAHSGSLSTVTRLLSAGADVAALDAESRSALHWAVISFDDDSGVLEALLDAGGDPDQRSGNGDSVVDYARVLNKPQKLQALTQN